MTMDATAPAGTLQAGRLQAGTLEAGGTMARPLVIANPALGRRLRLILEIGLLFIAGPLLIKYGVFGLRLPLFVVLAPVFLTLLFYLLWDDTFQVVREAGRAFSWEEAGSILGLFVGVGAIVTAFVSQRFPDEFLALPFNRPSLWAKIMLLYPVLSVVAQELIYRTFFFHRYGPLFGRARWLLILTNAAVFGLAHILYGSWVSIILSALFGVLLAWRYDRTRSFWAVWVEHSLYGCLVFTIGLGRYFFTGVGNVG